MEKSCILVIITITAGLIAGDDISSDQLEYFSLQGESVTLSCSYTATSDYIYLYWYRQHSNQAPQFILFKGASYTADFAEERFSSEVTDGRAPLSISNVHLGDSAVYYCALRPTVMY
uniref:Ig-like domain-containing protein n=1 Tax=Paramormyrops kingsleyae TaxID=1676925 RepID=A0A3B3Q4V1_9TELE